MSLADVYPAVLALPRADRMRLMQMLLADLAREEGIELLGAGAEYPVWSPYEAIDAAVTLQTLLAQETRQP